MIINLQDMTGLISFAEEQCKAINYIAHKDITGDCADLQKYIESQLESQLPSVIKDAIKGQKVNTCVDLDDLPTESDSLSVGL